MAGKSILAFEDRLFDNVYGYIGITQIEKEIIEGPSFQRLQHIRQLGLAGSIFPTGVHTRFSHSMGVLFVMDKMVTHLRSVGMNIDEKEHQALRLAALLHDIGHLPFSHAGEGATESHARQIAFNLDVEQIQATEQDKIENNPRSSLKLHESFSQIVVQHWNDINKVLAREKYNADEIGSIIVGGSGKTYQTLLLHSELDADRLDYLVRDSKNLGVAYGNIELDHIISSLRFKEVVEDQVIIGGTEKGFHALEHYLLARYLMYSQIIFNSKIYCLEQLLKKVYGYMLDLKPSDPCHVWTKPEFEKIIVENNRHDFYSFNDHLVYNKIRVLHDRLESKKTKTKIENGINNTIKFLLSGKIPRPIIESRELINQNDKIDTAKASFKNHLKDKIGETCKELRLHPDTVFFGVEYVKPTKLSHDKKIGKGTNKADAEEALRIIDESGEVSFVVDNTATILHHINNMQLQIIYVFANPIILEKTKVSRIRLEEVLRKNIDMGLRPGG